MACTANFMATNAHAFEHHELWARNVPAGVHSMCKMDQRVYCCVDQCARRTNGFTVVLITIPHDFAISTHRFARGARGGGAGGGGIGR